MARCPVLLGAALLLTMLLIVSAATSAQVGADSATGTSGSEGVRVGYARIDGPIDRSRERYFARAVADARAARLDTLVVHIDTDGGAVFEARDMLRTALEESKGALRLVAFVDFRAISAGAMIAYGHDEIYLTDTATIGDIGVILVGPDGRMEYALEKVRTVVRALLAQAAELKGWPRGPLLKMTARDQVLYRVAREGAPVDYVIEDDVADYRAAHPGVEFEDDPRVSVYRGKDRLLTLTGREAVSLGMANGIVADLDALYAQLGVTADDVTSYAPNLVERSAYALAIVAPLLSGLALLFLVFELKTPGVGVFALLSLACGALFLFAQYFQDLAENIEVVLMLVGAVLLAAELMTLAGGGLLGLLGAVCLLGGLLLAFVPNELPYDFGDPRFREALVGAAWRTLGALVVFLAGMLVLVNRLPKSRAIEGVGLRAEVTATSESAAALVPGTLAVAASDLRPGGKIELDGVQHSASADGGLPIPRGARVEVVSARFGELLVRALPTTTTADGQARRE